MFSVLFEHRWADGVACSIRLISLQLVEFQVFAVGSAVSSHANPFIDMIAMTRKPKGLCIG